MLEAHRAAHFELIAHATSLEVRDVSALEPQDDGRSSLTLAICVDGETIPLHILLPVAFPFGEIEIFVEAEWGRFAHEDAAGKICPWPDALSSRGPRRLVEAVEAAAEWLHEARAGTLALPGERYELPAFPLRRRDWCLLFDEEAAEHARWAGQLGASGRVILGKHARGWAPEEFRTQDGQVIAHRSSLRPPVGSTRITGRWMFIGAYVEAGYGAASTWVELRTLFPSLDEILKKAWQEDDGDSAVVLVGTPINGTWGGPPRGVHWQPIVFGSYAAARAAAKAGCRRNGKPVKGRQMTPSALWKVVGPLAGKEPVPWARSEDVSRDRLYVRTTPSHRAFESPLLIGCGAIGSALADTFARGGIPRMLLLDKDTLDYGNLCRHVLRGDSVGESKARMLRDHLELACPSIHVDPIGAVLPPRTTSDATSFAEASKAADLIIDASGDDEVLEWLGILERELPVASVWTNSDASIGVGVLSGAGDGLSVNQLRVHVRDAIDRGAVAGVSSEAYRGPDLIVPGTGCWHPTFRGSWARIVSLAAALSEWLTGAARGGRDGRCVVFRFRDGTWHRARSWSVPATRKAVGP